MIFNVGGGRDEFRGSYVPWRCIRYCRSPPSLTKINFRIESFVKQLVKKVVNVGLQLCVWQNKTATILRQRNSNSGIYFVWPTKLLRLCKSSSVVVDGGPTDFGNNFCTQLQITGNKLCWAFEMDATTDYTHLIQIDLLAQTDLKEPTYALYSVSVVVVVPTAKRR